MSERAATQEVAAERFVMVVIEIRNIDAGCDVTSEPIAAVEIEDAVARIPDRHTSPEPAEPIHPAVPHQAADPVPPGTPSRR